MTAALKNYKITPFEVRTLSWWKTRRTKIDMDPPYQRRGRLWSDTDKAYLIDSILNGFDVPKLYVADFTWGDSKLNKKKLPYAIIDGKQRFEAIFDFFDSKIPLNEDFILHANPELELAGLAYKDIQANYPELAEQFDNYNLFVMSVSAQTDEPINELFVRLNRSKPLTGAEIRNAMGGPAPAVIRFVAKHRLFSENVNFDVQRAQDQNAAAKILLFEYDDAPADTKKANLDKFVEEHEGKKKGTLELVGRRVMDVLEEMTEVFLPKDRLLTAGIFPVYYWLVRNAPQSRIHQVRDFLVQFERERKANRDREPNDIEETELTEYDNWNRSTNDQSSHIGRYDILKRRFARWRP